jgi:hypothetical protein
MAGLDYRLVARGFHDLFMLEGDPPVNNIAHGKNPGQACSQH